MSGSAGPGNLSDMVCNRISPAYAKALLMGMSVAWLCCTQFACYSMRTTYSRKHTVVDACDVFSNTLLYRCSLSSCFILPGVQSHGCTHTSLFFPVRFRTFVYRLWCILMCTVARLYKFVCVCCTYRYALSAVVGREQVRSAMISRLELKLSPFKFLIFGWPIFSAPRFHCQHFLLVDLFNWSSEWVEIWYSSSCNVSHPFVFSRFVIHSLCTTSLNPCGAIKSKILQWIDSFVGRFCGVQEHGSLSANLQFVRVLSLRHTVAHIGQVIPIKEGYFLLNGIEQTTEKFYSIFPLKGIHRLFSRFFCVRDPIECHWSGNTLPESTLRTQYGTLTLHTAEYMSIMMLVALSYYLATCTNLEKFWCFCANVYTWCRVPHSTDAVPNGLSLRDHSGPV